MKLPSLFENQKLLHLYMNENANANMTIENVNHN